MKRVLLFCAISFLLLAFGAAFMRAAFQRQVVVKIEKMPKESESEPTRNFLFPDMIVIEPNQLSINISGGVKSLRFSTTFANQGAGPLEIIGQTQPDEEVTHATQYIQETGGPGDYRPIGAFVLHPTHRHWHVANYVRYEIRSVNKGVPGDLVAETDKMSFCIWDENIHNRELPGAPSRQVYSSDCTKKFQGMSVGWSDTYASRVDGQTIDITNLPDGQYFFITEVNPERKISESNYDNNTTAVMIEITGNRVTKI